MIVANIASDSWSQTLRLRRPPEVGVEFYVGFPASVLAFLYRCASASAPHRLNFRKFHIPVVKNGLWTPREAYAGRFAIVNPRLQVDIIFDPTTASCGLDRWAMRKTSPQFPYPVPSPQCLPLYSLGISNPLARDPTGQRSRSGFDPLCGSLRTSLHLRTLLLRAVGIDDVETEGVASFLALSVRLEQLDLSENQACFETRRSALTYWSEVRSKHRTQDFLNQIQQVYFVSVRTHRVGRFFQRVPYSSFGCFPMSQIHVRGARYLAGALRSNGSLLSLLLGRNEIWNEGALLLAAAIPHAASLVNIE